MPKLGTHTTCDPAGRPPWVRDRTIADYGGALDKEATATETVPYAWIWYSELRAMRGSAYRQESAGLVHAENIAIARSEAARTRAAEKLVANSQPSTAGERLGYWATVLQPSHKPTDSEAAVRARCAALYKAGIGPTIAQTDEACSELLGDAFVRTWRSEGTDLANPPQQTYWPTANPGGSGYDLGGGAWFSERCHLIVEVEQPDEMARADYDELITVHLFQLLDRMLPAWATFDWGEDVADGFTLDLSELDWGVMGP
jgi:hypothetical protein